MGVEDKIVGPDGSSEELGPVTDGLVPFSGEGEETPNVGRLDISSIRESAKGLFPDDPNKEKRYEQIFLGAFSGPNETGVTIDSIRGSAERLFPGDIGKQGRYIEVVSGAFLGVAGSVSDRDPASTRRKGITKKERIDRLERRRQSLISGGGDNKDLIDQIERQLAEIMSPTKREEVAELKRKRKILKGILEKNPLSEEHKKSLFEIDRRLIELTTKPKSEEERKQEEIDQLKKELVALENLQSYTKTKDDYDSREEVERRTAEIDRRLIELTTKPKSEEETTKPKSEEETTKPKSEEETPDTDREEEGGAGLDVRLDALEDTREAYVQAYVAYNDKLRSSSLLNKIRAKLGGLKQESEEKLPPEILEAKRRYDDMKLECGRYLYQAKEAALLEGKISEDERSFLIATIDPDSPEASKILERTRKGELSPVQVDQLLRRFKGKELFDTLVKRERDLLFEAEAEKWTPKERSLFRKGLAWYLKQPVWARVGMTSALLAFPAASVSGIGAAAVFGGATMARGFMSIGAGILAGKAFEKIIKDKSGVAYDEAEAQIRRTYSENRVGQLQTEEELEEARQEMARKQRRYLLAKGLTMTAVAMNTAAVLNWLFPGVVTLDKNENPGGKVSPTQSADDLTHGSKTVAPGSVEVPNAPSSPEVAVGAGADLIKTTDSSIGRISESFRDNLESAKGGISDVIRDARNQITSKLENLNPPTTGVTESLSLDVVATGNHDNLWGAIKHVLGGRSGWGELTIGQQDAAVDSLYQGIRSNPDKLLQVGITTPLTKIPEGTVFRLGRVLDQSTLDGAINYGQAVSSGAASQIAKNAIKILNWHIDNPNKELTETVANSLIQ